MTCFKAAVKFCEARANDLRPFNAFIRCYERETPSCDYSIVQHILQNTLTQALGKHLTEEAGLLGGMLEKIKP